MLGGENSRRIPRRKGGRLHSRSEASVEINEPQSKRFTVTFVWQRSAVAVEGETLATANDQRFENALCRSRRIFKETVRIVRFAIVLGEDDPPHKKIPPGEFPRGGLGLT
jgi:hypothetical protein